MTHLPTRLHAVTILAALAAGVFLAAPSADAGVLDTFRNVRDTLKCSSKAVFNPLRVVDWGIGNFENLTGEEYERRADQSMKEALDECREAAGNIVARGFGVEKIVAKARDSAARAKNAANTIARWVGKGTAAPDGRMALAVNGRERRFHEQETGVLGREPLPAVKAPTPPGDATRPNDGTRRGGAVSANAWDAAPDPWSDAGSGGQGGAGAAAASGEADPWGRTEAVAQNPPPSVADGNGDTDHGGGSHTAALDAVPGGTPREARAEDEYAAALAAALGDTPQRETAEDDYTGALAALERREAEARRAAEAERQRAEREAEVARQQAEAERQQAEREAELARQQAEAEHRQALAEAAAARRANAEAWRRLGQTLNQTLMDTATTLRNLQSGDALSSGIPSMPSPGMEPGSHGTSGSGDCAAGLALVKRWEAALHEADRSLSAENVDAANALAHEIEEFSRAHPHC